MRTKSCASTFQAVECTNHNGFLALVRSELRTEDGPYILGHRSCDVCIIKHVTCLNLEIIQGSKHKGNTHGVARYDTGVGHGHEGFSSVATCDELSLMAKSLPSLLSKITSLGCTNGSGQSPCWEGS